MPNPAVLAPIVQGGMSIGGNLFAAREGKKAWRRQQRAQDQEYARQKEFAQMGIRWKVEDAKAAGLHPLYALGAMPSNYSPAMIQSPPSSGIAESMHEAGQAISRSMMATQTNQEKQMQQMALEAHIANMAESDMRRQVLESERDRNYQEMNRGLWDSIPTVTPDYGVPEGQAPAVLPDVAPASFVPHGLIAPKAPTVFSSPRGDSSTADGPTPMWRRFTVANGAEIVLPGGMSGDAAEVLESLAESPILMAAVIAENDQRGNGAAIRRYLPKSKDSSWWRKPGEWIGGKLADLRDRARHGADVRSRSIRPYR